MDVILTNLNVIMAKLFPGSEPVSNLHRLSGGASQETWSFQQDHGVAGPQKYILRRAPFSGQRSSEAIGLRSEAELIKAAARAGTPVPETLYVCCPEDGLGDAFIMAHVEGETIARKILRDPAFETARTKLAAQCGHALALIHKIPLLECPENIPKSSGLDQLTRYEEIYRGFNVNRPVFELAFAWLRGRAPEPVPARLVHGDFRNGNLIVGPDGLRAVLDWELAHIGDPREDLGWICVNSWRFGMSHNPVGGFGGRADFLRAYEEAGGQAFDQGDIAWFQALGSLKWGIMCLIMYSAFHSGADRSIERAMIGRRASEAEIDLLNLMENKPDA
jgi:aminoglycoside phosphotransferase (APT) family kinase protein